MGDTAIILRFQGTLDPTAQEFTPNHIPLSFSLALPYPYPYPYPHYAATPPPHLSPSPTRSLLLTPVPPTASHSDLRKDLQSFGDVRALHTESLPYGIVTVHYCDLRHAQTAFTAIRTHHVHSVSFYNPLCPQFNTSPPPPGIVAGSPLWANYVLPDAQNQGTLVVFNLDADVSSHHLRQVFEPFGPIKEVRDTLGKKKNERFVEFFDIRDAAKALKQMNGKEINGKSVSIEFSKVGFGRKFYHSAYPTYASNKPLHFNINPPLLPPTPHFSHRFDPRYHSPQPPQFSPNNFTCNRGSTNNRLEEQNSPRRNFVRSNSMDTMSNRTWNWRGKQGKKHETRFVIKEDAIVESSFRDSRTTVMIKNIPNKYSQKLLLNMLDNHCIHCNEQIGDGDDQPLSSYDFVYLPIDFKNKCNVGYGFVNMTSPEATLRLYKAFHHQHWEVFNSRKICQITYARVQGLEALKEHFKNSKFPCEMKHYLPVVFSPARDGRKMTEPIPVVGMVNSPVDEEMKSEGVGDNDENSKAAEEAK